MSRLIRPPEISSNSRFISTIPRCTGCSGGSECANFSTRRADPSRVPPPKKTAYPAVAAKIPTRSPTTKFDAD